MKARITVMPKRTVLDPQGEAVKEAIHHLGLEAVKEARVGKFIELRVDGLGEAEARRRLEAICHDLLSNPVIEEYALEIDGSAAASGAGRPAKKAVIKKTRKAAPKGTGKHARASARAVKGKGRRKRR